MDWCFIIKYYHCITAIYWPTDIYWPTAKCLLCAPFIPLSKIAKKKVALPVPNNGCGRFYWASPYFQVISIGMPSKKLWDSSNLHVHWDVCRLMNTWLLGHTHTNVFLIQTIPRETRRKRGLVEKYVQNQFCILHPAPPRKSLSNSPATHILAYQSSYMHGDANHF